MNIFKKLFTKKTKFGFDASLQDERDFTFSPFNFFASYKPKNTYVNNKPDWQPTRDQKSLGTCVCESGSGQKEKDEGIGLSAQEMTNYLVKQGLMTKNGTSLSAFQNALKDRGIAEATYSENDYNMSFNDFSNNNKLKEGHEENAKIHKSASFYRSYDHKNVLEELDNGKIGHTAIDWKTGYYTQTIRKNNYILNYGDGSYEGGHAVRVIGYNLDYNGEKVFIMENSWGESYGDKGLFYIKFKDYETFCKYGTYFNEDIEKDVLSFLSVYNNKPVKELSGNKVYLIQNKKKRHIPDEAMLEMMDFVWWKDVSIDKDNVLEQVEEGNEITFNDLNEEQQARAKQRVSNYGNADFFKSRYQKYFPEVFKS